LAFLGPAAMEVCVIEELSVMSDAEGRFGYREAMVLVERSLRERLRDEERERRRRLAGPVVSPFDERGLVLPWRRAL